MSRIGPEINHPRLNNAFSVDTRPHTTHLDKRCLLLLVLKMSLPTPNRTSLWCLSKAGLFDFLHLGQQVVHLERLRGPGHQGLVLLLKELGHQLPENMGRGGGVCASAQGLACGGVQAIMGWERKAEDLKRELLPHLLMLFQEVWAPKYEKGSIT